MNFKEFCAQYAAENGIPKTKSKDICIGFFECLARCVDENDRLYIKGFGTFKKKKFKEHRVGNFKGGEPIVIPETEKVVFEQYVATDPAPEDEEEYLF